MYKRRFFIINTNYKPSINNRKKVKFKKQLTR